MARTTTSPELSPTRIWTGTPCERKTPSAYCATDSCIRSAAVARSHRVILVRKRRTEERHNAVAHHLVDGPLVAVDGLHHVLEYGIEQLPRLLGIAVGEELHRALEIGEQHGDLLALAFESSLGGEDSLGEVLWAIRFGRAEAPALRPGLFSGGQRLAALLAQLVAGRIRSPALGADSGELRTALRAEFGVRMGALLAPGTFHAVL